MSYRFADSLRAGSGWNSVHVEFHLKNKFEKVVHLVDISSKGAIIRNSYEIYNELFCHSIRL
jgi:hypothetical protein